jgi:hypothetical protein
MMNAKRAQQPKRDTMSLAVKQQTVSSAMGIPIYLGNMVEATLLLVTLGMFILPNYRIKVINPTPRKEERV